MKTLSKQRRQRGERHLVALPYLKDIQIWGGGNLVPPINHGPSSLIYLSFSTPTASLHEYSVRLEHIFLTISKPETGFLPLPAV